TNVNEQSVGDPHRDRLYRPLTLFSFALNYAADAARGALGPHGEPRPLGFLLVNWLLHAACCALLWVFARRLFGDVLLATAAALALMPFTILGQYVRLLVLPDKLSADYGLGVLNPDDGVTPLTLVGIAAAAALLTALLGFFRPPGVWRQLAVLTGLALLSYAL